MTEDKITKDKIRAALRALRNDPDHQAMEKAMLKNAANPRIRREIRKRAITMLQKRIQEIREYLSSNSPEPAEEARLNAEIKFCEDSLREYAASAGPP